MVESAGVFMFVAATAMAAAPQIFYLDLVSGPNSGGAHDLGVFVTVTGKNFGAQRGSSYISIGSGTAGNYVFWSDTKIIFQPGHNARTGAVIVTTPEGSSNSVYFSVRPGAIYFVDDTSENNPGRGTYADPWRSPKSFYQVMKPGDTCYFRAGTYSEKYGEQNSNSNFNFGENAPSGQPGNEIAFVAYPGETVQLVANTKEVFTNIAFGYPKSHYVIAGFYMYATANCIGLNGDDNRIVNNKCEGLKTHSYSIINPVGGSGSKCYGNELFGATSGDKLDHPLYIGYGTSNFDFGWNYIHNNDVAEGPLISINEDNAGVNNTVFRNIQIHDNIIDCRYSSCPQRAVGIIATGKGSAVFVCNNIIIEPGGTALYQYSGSGFYYRNTIYQAKGAAAISIAAVRDGKNDYRPETVEIRKNIIHVKDGCEYVKIDNGHLIGKLVIEQNCYYGNGKGPAADSEAVNKNPRFTDARLFDFRTIREVGDIGCDTSFIPKVGPENNLPENAKKHDNVNK